MHHVRSALDIPVELADSVLLGSPCAEILVGDGVCKEASFLVDQRSYTKNKIQKYALEMRMRAQGVEPSSLVHR